MARAAITRVSQFDVVVRDMEASVAFYRRLGLAVDHDNPDHVQVQVEGLSLELDSAGSVPKWDRGWRGGMGILGFEVASREGVDDLYVELTDAGYQGQQPPFDAPWGRRYAVVEDPDGNAIGLMSAD